MILRILASLVIAAVFGFGWMYIDNSRGAEWQVSPQQIAEAKAQGKRGYETRPGSIAVLPIRSETADILPFKWALGGLFAGGVALALLARKKAS
jgi:hypothetical protein